MPAAVSDAMQMVREPCCLAASLVSVSSSVLHSGSCLSCVRLAIRAPLRNWCEGHVLRISGIVHAMFMLTFAAALRRNGYSWIQGGYPNRNGCQISWESPSLLGSYGRRWEVGLVMNLGLPWFRMEYMLKVTRVLSLGKTRLREKG